MIRPIKYLMRGIAYGCVIFVLMGMILVASGNGQLCSDTEFIRQAIGAIIVGIGFGSTAIVYESEKLAIGMKVIIHMGTGFAVFFPVAVWLQWLPTQNGIGVFIPIAIMMIIGSFVVWGCFCLYYMWLAKELSKKIRKKQ